MASFPSFGAKGMNQKDLEVRRALYASSGVFLDSEHDPVRVLEPERQVVPLGAFSGCAVRVELRLCIAALRSQLSPQPCPWCKKARGWTHCAEHDLLESLERAAGCVTELGRVWDWAYALGYYWSPRTLAWGYWTDAPPDAPPEYVPGAADDAAAYSRAILEACSGLP